VELWQRCFMDFVIHAEKPTRAVTAQA
jgi:hypothetical protein